MEVSEKVLWSVAEVCQYLGLGRTHVMELTYAGKLPSVRIGRRRLYPAAKIMEWIDSLQADRVAVDGRRT
jgi:excisionase family DNA binding protein